MSYITVPSVLRDSDKIVFNVKQRQNVEIFVKGNMVYSAICALVFTGDPAPPGDGASVNIMAHALVEVLRCLILY